MARKLDDTQQADLTEFVNRLATAAGYASSAEWARESGYAYPNLTNLRREKGAIDGFNLLRLIQAAARRAELEPEVLALLAARAEPAGSSDAQRELLSRLRRVEDEVDALRQERAELVGGVVARLVLLEEAAGIAAQRSARRSRGGVR